MAQKTEIAEHSVVFDNDFSDSEELKTDSPLEDPGDGQRSTTLNDHNEPCLRKEMSDRGDSGGSALGGAASESTNWILEEDDLMCLPLVTEGLANQAKWKKSKTQKRTGFRLLNRRSAGSKAYGGTRMKYTSMLGLITTIAKTSGIDIAKLLENSGEVFGPKMNMRLPCMQCYETPGGSGDVSSMLSSVIGGYGQNDEIASGGAGDRCPKCGGQVLTFASFGRMISQMRIVLQEKKLVAHDVYPDGNCLFAAVVDQLRIRGDFSFTQSSLRQAAVQYLRDNPMADDGLTPLEMFLTDNETWEDYLARMDEDGEWGDHIVLSAISNLTGMQIAIFGGMTGKGETVIQPKIMSGNELKEGASAAVDVSNTICLGHMTESHYMSLRPKGWKVTFYEGMKSKVQEFRSDTCHKTSFPVQAINLTLKQVFRMNYLQSFMSDVVETGRLSLPLSTSEVKVEMVGSTMAMMFPCKLRNDSTVPDVSVFFPGEEECIFSGDAVLTLLRIPTDTTVVTLEVRAGLVDLVAECDELLPNKLHLIPTKPILWAGQTVETDNGRSFLKIFDLENDFTKSIKSVMDSCMTGSKLNPLLAFKCEWPESASEWPTRERISNFPDMKTVQAVLDTGCHAIPYTKDVKLNDILDHPVHEDEVIDDYTWCYTFANAEKEISRFLTQEQRQCFLLFKVWVDNVATNPVIHNSILKSTFFYACENIDKGKWKSMPGECLLILLKSLVRFLNERRAPHYFIVGENLLNGFSTDVIKSWTEKLKLTQAQPFVYLYFVLDKLDVLSSEVGSFVEEVMQEISNDDMLSSSALDHGALMPAASNLLQNLIYQDDYQSAMCILEDSVEPGKQLKEITEIYGAFLKRACWDMDISYQCAFALFVDIKLKTELTNHLCEGLGKVHITKLFGPECLQELPDTHLPEKFKIENGDIMFAYTLTSVFSQCISQKCSNKALKHYLKTYAALAGDSLILPCTTEVQEFKKRTAYGQQQMTQSLSYIYQTSLLYTLHDLYVIVFNNCQAGQQVEEFRDMMPTMTKIVEMMGTQTSKRNLKYIWQALGEKQKAAEINVSYGSGNSASRYIAILSPGYE